MRPKQPMVDGSKARMTAKVPSSVSSRRITPWEWDTHIGTIEELYLGQGMTLKSVIDVMAAEYGFTAS